MGKMSKMSFKMFCEIHQCTDEEVIGLICHLMVFRSMAQYMSYVRLNPITER